MPIHRKMWLAPEHFQIGIQTSLKLHIYFWFFSGTPDMGWGDGPQFSAACKIWCKSVKNSRQNCLRTDVIETKTAICTSLTSSFYFQFCRAPSTMSMLLNFLLCTEFYTNLFIRRDWKVSNRNLHTSNKIQYLLQVVLKNARTDQNSELHIKFGATEQLGKNSGHNRSTVDVISTKTGICASLKSYCNSMSSFVDHQVKSQHCLVLTVCGILC